MVPYGTDALQKGETARNRDIVLLVTMGNDNRYPQVFGEDGVINIISIECDLHVHHKTLTKTNRFTMLFMKYDYSMDFITCRHLSYLVVELDTCLILIY